MITCNKITRSEFTVLLPTYNRSDLYILFDSAVNSVYNNTILPKETIIIIDGPVSDEFKNKINHYKSKFNLNVLWLPCNVGLTKALNIGLNLVSTKWVFRADGDDINMPTRFESQLKYLELGYDLVGGCIQEINQNGEMLQKRRVPLLQGDIVKMAKRRNPFNHMTVAFNTDLAKAVGGYPDLYLKEDYGLWTLFIKNGAKILNLSDILVHATTGNQLYSRRSGFKYIKSEFYLQKHLIMCGVSSKAEALFFGFLRIIALATPSSLKKHIYKKYLRNEN